MYLHTLCRKVYFYASARGKPPLPPDSSFGTPWDANMYQKTLLKKGAENEGTWSPKGTPKWSPNRKIFEKKINFGVLPRACGKEVAKIVILGPPRRLKMRLAPRRQLDFHFSQGLPKNSKNGAKMDPKGSQIPPKTPRSRSKSVPEKYTKNDTEIGAKREPKWTPNGNQNRLKIDFGRGPGAEGVRQGSPRPSQGAFWEPFW